jgi:hypothetical protein
VTRVAVVAIAALGRSPTLVSPTSTSMLDSVMQLNIEFSLKAEALDEAPHPAPLRRSNA